MYCNLLQCTHFGATSALAEAEGDAVGFVSGYSPPQHPDALFVWQVAVDERARGHGLAKRLIMDILQRPGNEHLHYIRTTITAQNDRLLGHVPRSRPQAGRAHRGASAVRSGRTLRRRARKASTNWLSAPFQIQRN